MQQKKTYNPKSIEAQVTATWQQTQCLEQQADANQNYCIMLPPPNVTGSLHMGHAFQDTIMDSLIRYQKMQGKTTLWQVGTDHAGIATQMLVERKLEQEQGLSKYDLGRDKFMEQIWSWKEQCGDQISAQMQRLGVAANWDKARFTMDKGFNKAVTTAFVKLHQDNLIYRGKRLVNWDPVLTTAISDLEVTNTEKQGNMWYIKYPLANNATTKSGLNYLLVGTTRPETLLGDSAIAVNPDDARFSDLIGKQAILPLTNRTIPIIGDDYADMEKGTGCVKITPAHDFNDYEVGKRHQLPLYNIFCKQGTILPAIEHFQYHNTKQQESLTIPKAYAGLDRFVARKTIIKDLQTAELLDKIEPQTIMIPQGDRSNAVIEPMLTDQWYVATKTLAATAKAAVDSGEIEFIPNQYQNMYNAWMNDITDWCISRQLWWGHRIPAWYDADNNIYVGYDEADVRQKYQLADNLELHQDEDVLDTWFSSSLWTFATLGWPETTEDLHRFHPTDVLVTGFDIIFFWVARMIMMTMHFIKDESGKPQVPFKKVYVTGLIRDEDGLKMSKSKGNVIDPLDMIDGIDLTSLVAKRTSNLMQPKLRAKIKKQTEKNFPNGIIEHGTDALRFTLASLASTGRDINWDMKRLEGYRNFCNKIFQAANYVNLTVQAETKYNLEQAINATNLSIADQWILSKLQTAITDTNNAIANYRFDLAANTIYEFTWNEYCSWYLELSKISLKHGQVEHEFGTKHTLVYVLESLMRLMHPIMPYITEHLWQELKATAKLPQASIVATPYPQAKVELSKPSIEQDIDFIKNIIVAVRNIRAQYNIAFTKKLNLHIKNINANNKQLLLANLHIITNSVKIEQIVFINQEEKLIAAKQLVGTTEILIPMAEFLDVAAEQARIDKQINKLKQETQALQGKLANANFVNKAPAALVAQEQTKLKTALANINSLQEQIQQLQQM